MHEKQYALHGSINWERKKAGGENNFEVKFIKKMEPAAGFEPATDGLQNRSSTTELSRHSVLLIEQALKREHNIICHIF